MKNSTKPRWSIGDIDDIERTIYMLNRPSNEDTTDDLNFGWNSPIKYHRFAATPSASGKKTKQGQYATQSDENSFPNRQHFISSSLDSLLKSAEHPNMRNQSNVDISIERAVGMNRPLASTINAKSDARSSNVILNQPEVHMDVFLTNAKKQLEFELARERNEAVVKLRKILAEGAKSHIEQKRQEVVGRMVGQTDAILQQAYTEIITETQNLFGSIPSKLQLPTPSRDSSTVNFRDMMKRIKVAEQEKIKDRVQQSVQQVASQFMREEAELRERRQTQDLMVK